LAALISGHGRAAARGAKREDQDHAELPTGHDALL
jgi:hypothetical protein